MSLGEVCNSHKLSVKLGVQELVRVAMDILWQAHVIKAWTGPKRDGGMSELDTGQV